MASTAYSLTTADWTNCGAADDCTVQVVGDGTVAFTTASSAPSAGTATGLVLSSNKGDARNATVVRAGKTLYARALVGTASVVVER
mgnify:CR=1 FL=1